tara:strand:- start:69 stop:1973 length:1905 start_codon:yes stop_codon:yes gene_type:complete
MAITTITNAMVSVNAIQGTLIADNAITAVHIATNAVSGTLIADNAVTATHIAQNTITVTQLADDAVEADKIADGVITTNHLNKAMISSQTQVTAVAGDFLLIGDTSDSNNLKKIPISGITSLVSSFDADAAQTFNESGNDVDFRVESNNNADMLFVDGGNDNVLLGTQNQGHVRLNQQLGMAVTGNVYGGISMATHSSSAGGNRSLLDFNRSRNTTIGSHTVVNSGDSLGTIVGRGDDGDEFLDAASIDFEVDGTPGDGDMPGRIVFATTADGAGSVTERMRINSSGNVGIGTASPSSLLHMESGNAHNKLSITSTANGGTGYDAVIDLLGSASNSEVQLNMGINGDADREQIKTYQSVMTFTTNNVERMKIDTADIVLTTTGNANAQLSIKNSSASGQSGVQLSGYDDNHAMTFRRGYDGSLNVIDFYEYGNSGGDAYRWFTNGVQANQTQKLNLQTDGELIQGTAIADTYSPLVVGITADALVAGRHATSGSLGIWRTNTMEFKVYHNGQGYIMTWGSNGVVSGDFNDTSDVNLKENISTIADGTTVIKALRPVKFDWKASGKGNNQHGFIAQEVETVLPDAVEGNNYVENETGLPEDEPAGNGKTMNSNAVLAHAVKAIQELEARIKTLEG